MKECEFLLSIDNKEILIEILNHSIDFLIGNQDEQQTIRMCHKYGFHNPDDFLLATRSLSKLYRELCCSDTGGMLETKMGLTKLSPDLQGIISSVLCARRTEVTRFLIRDQNCIECPLIEWFDWNTRLVLGDSSFASNTKLLTALTFHLRQYNTRSKDDHQSIHFQMSMGKLDEFILVLENLLKESSE